MIIKEPPWTREKTRLRGVETIVRSAEEKGSVEGSNVSTTQNFGIEIIDPETSGWLKLDIRRYDASSEIYCHEKALPVLKMEVGSGG